VAKYGVNRLPALRRKRFGNNVGARPQVLSYVGGVQNQPYANGNTDGLRQKFDGKERDTETGLDYSIARYYSSSLGRFTTPDEFNGGPQEFTRLCR